VRRGPGAGELVCPWWGGDGEALLLGTGGGGAPATGGHVLLGCRCWGLAHACGAPSREALCTRAGLYCGEGYEDGCACGTPGSAVGPPWFEVPAPQSAVGPGVRE